MTTFKIAALGSSFAAGPGIYPISDQKARRSTRNYANLLASKLDARLTDLTVSGATLQNVLNEPQKLAWNEPSFPPQLDGLPSDVDIITLTGGGNDLGYSKGMISESMMASLPTIISWPLSFFMSPTASTMTSSELADRFIAIVDKARDIAPRAQIYLVEYITVFGDATIQNVSVSLSQAAISRYSGLESILLEAYEMTAKARPDVKLIRVNELSKGHCVGSKDPWVTGFSWMGLWHGEVPYHPNAEAHEVIAEELYRDIR